MMRVPADRQLLHGILSSPVGRLTMGSYLRDSRGILDGGRLRVFGSYAIVYLLDGRGRYVDARGVDREVTAGDLILVFPELGHAYGPAPGEHWDEIYLVFDGPVFDLWRREGVISPERPVLHLEPVEYWAGRWESVLTDLPEPLPAVTRLVSLLSEVVEVAKMEGMGVPLRQWMGKAKALLEPCGKSTPLSLEQVAEELGMSYVAFRRQFAQLAGDTPGHYRIRRRVDHACQLIQSRPGIGNK